MPDEIVRIYWYNTNWQKVHTGQHQPFENGAAQQQPEPVKAQLQGLGRSILPPGNPHHGSNVADLQAHTHRTLEHRLARGSTLSPI